VVPPRAWDFLEAPAHVSSRPASKIQVVQILFFCNESGMLRIAQIFLRAICTLRATFRRAFVFNDGFAVEVRKY
jgi:hypothetical protein